MLNSIAPDMEFAHNLFAELDQHWAGPEKGMVRPGYSQQENEAVSVIAKAALNLGMQIYQDLAGNTYFVYKGKDSTKPVLLMGSHLDAVPQGGRYDGPAGVIAALTAVKHLHDQKIVPPQDVCVVAWRHEEVPPFNQFAIGSHLAVGQFGIDILERKKGDGDERTLEDHMKSVGLDTEALRKAIRSGQSLLPLDRVGSSLEVHIEQGKVLALAGTLIGIVTDIRGNVRFPNMIHFHGKAGHTGTVPQDERRDAAYAAMLFGVEAANELEALRAKGHDLVWSFPEISTGAEAAPTKIPDYCAVRPEARSTEDKVIKAAEDIYFRCAEAAARRTGTTFKPYEVMVARSKPASMNSDLQKCFEEIANHEDIKVMRLPSGANHDSGVLALAGVPAAMLFLAHEGPSHVPQEIMTVIEEDDPFATQSSFHAAVTMLSGMAELSPIRQDKGEVFAEALKARGAKVLRI